MIFSNTTPFIALASIHRLELMKDLFQRVNIAESVLNECREGGSVFVPNLEQFDWISTHKDVLSVKMPVLLELDKGEKQTIAVALNYPEATVLIDEKIGRDIAFELGE